MTLNGFLESIGWRPRQKVRERFKAMMAEREGSRLLRACIENERATMEAATEFEGAARLAAKHFQGKLHGSH